MIITITKIPSKLKNGFLVNTGYVQLAASKTIHHPPFAVRWKNKWWQTLQSKDVILANFEPLDFGLYRLFDYFDRTRKTYCDLPMLPEKSLAASVMHFKNRG
jgi:hypothetical protein